MKTRAGFQIPPRHLLKDTVWLLTGVPNTSLAPSQALGPHTEAAWITTPLAKALGKAPFSTVVGLVGFLFWGVGRGRLDFYRFTQPGGSWRQLAHVRSSVRWNGHGTEGKRRQTRAADPLFWQQGPVKLVPVVTHTFHHQLPSQWTTNNPTIKYLCAISIPFHSPGFRERSPQHSYAQSHSSQVLLSRCWAGGQGESILTSTHTLPWDTQSPHS